MKATVQHIKVLMNETPPRMVFEKKEEVEMAPYNPYGNKYEQLKVLKEKYLLTVNEACDYFGIGEKKLRLMIQDNPDAEFFIMNGTKYLIKRKLFEEMLDKATCL